jgi:ABC-2 type transport system ATP-binding protein
MSLLLDDADSAAARREGRATAAGSLPPALRLRGVSKRFGATRALDDVDLVVDQGEFLGLLGPNGAGKSTLLGVLAGVVRADRGHAWVLGHDVARDYRAARSALGFVPQELAFDPFLTVRESLELQAGYFGLGRAARPWIAELLEALGLTSRAGSEMRALSGGMKRRVLVAQALVHRPAVVILDEPTAGVDAEMRAALWALVGELHRAGHTFVLTTHHLEEAERMCARVAVMRDGRIVALERRAELLARVARPVLRVALREELAALPDALRAVLLTRGPRELVFALGPRGGDPGALVAALRAAGAAIAALETPTPTLADVLAPLDAEARA